MKNRRSRLLIEPHFQTRLILRLGAWVLLSTLITAAVTLIFLRTRIILPPLLISLAINLALTFIFTLLYSQRLAGPIHRLITEMVKIERGDTVKPLFNLRGSDELQDIAVAFDGMLKRLEAKGALKTK